MIVWNVRCPCHIQNQISGTRAQLRWTRKSCKTQFTASVYREFQYMLVFWCPTFLQLFIMALIYLWKWNGYDYILYFSFCWSTPLLSWRYMIDSWTTSRVLSFYNLYMYTPLSFLILINTNISISKFIFIPGIMGASSRYTFINRGSLHVHIRPAVRGPTQAALRGVGAQDTQPAATWFRTIRMSDINHSTYRTRCISQNCR